MSDKALNLTLMANILAREIGGAALNNGTGWSSDDEYDVSAAAVLALASLQAAHAAGVAAERARIRRLLEAEIQDHLMTTAESMEIPVAMANALHILLGKLKVSP